MAALAICAITAPVFQASAASSRITQVAVDLDSGQATLGERLPVQASRLIGSTEENVAEVTVPQLAELTHGRG